MFPTQKQEQLTQKTLKIRVLATASTNLQCLKKSSFSNSANVIRPFLIGSQRKKKKKKKRKRKKEKETLVALNEQRPPTAKNKPIEKKIATRQRGRDEERKKGKKEEKGDREKREREEEAAGVISITALKGAAQFLSSS